MVQLISEEYRQLNQELHETDKTWGETNKNLLTMIGNLTNKYNINSILDYGAGKQSLAKFFENDHRVKSYDPAIPEISATPEPADLVVCTATLEHVETQYLENVLIDLERCTRIAVFITVTTIPSKKILSNGKNPHQIIEPIEWWLPILMKYWSINEVKREKNAFLFFGTKKSI